MDLKNLTKIETAAQYDAVCIRVDKLIREASGKGLLACEYDNEYTREIGRLSRMGAIYEDEYMTFEHIKAGKQVPLRQCLEKVDDNLVVEYA
jgi:hypothetical protein